MHGAGISVLTPRLLRNHRGAAWRRPRERVKAELRRLPLRPPARGLPEEAVANVGPFAHEPAGRQWQAQGQVSEPEQMRVVGFIAVEQISYASRYARSRK